MDNTVETMTRSLCAALRTSAQGLLEITHETLIEREKGLYGVMYAKPTRRLASTLAVDREVLVLISTFTDQQARTISLGSSLIKGSAGRLESTVFMVVHKDPRGNQKLKRWGRENALTVLPVYCTGTSLPATNEFERLLSHELFAHDPFDVTGPVDDDEQFFGRRTEAQDLARHLQDGQIRACFGIRKIGKTSILHRILKDCLRNHDCYCVMVDCSIDELWNASAVQLMESIKAAMSQAIQSEERYAATCAVPLSRKTINDASRDIQHLIHEVEKPIIVFFDEVDYISPGSPTATHWKAEFNVFWRALRATYQEVSRTSKTLSLMIGGVSSKWFTTESIGGIENAALAFVPEEYLTPLPRGAALAMIKKMSRRAGLSFDEEAADLVVQACSDMPFWIRKACSYIHKKVEIQSRPILITSKMVQPVLNEFVQSDGATMAHVALSHLFKVFPELESVCCASASGDASGQSQHLLLILHKYGVLGRRPTFSLSGGMIANGLALYQEKVAMQAETAATADTTPAKAKTEHNLGDWAEDLALISRQRNIFEKQFREVALNFIRYDSLGNKQSKPLRERILAAIPEDRRARLADVPSNELLSNFYWLELLALVKKEWPLFEKLFNDKSALEVNWKLVNERPDAHAKDMDPADFALYRRSLDWLSERL